MELFKLLGTIAINNDGANKAIDDTTSLSEVAGTKIKGAFAMIGNAALAVGKTVATGLAVGSAAVAGLAKKAIDGYADYEQLVGGVETLFGAGGQKLEEYAQSVGKSVDDAKEEFYKLLSVENTVLRNADEAYKTAGMSANEYLETVTSFSASLIQSMGGDTEKAAQKANQAIIDMSDNANKMGSDISSIQNAYSGFAKQNYTMLDNLKLGYGGTKEEMARLIQDAAKLKDVQEELGVTVDANSMSYGNIVDAISVVQKSMGITGTTAKEASETISGSIATMKSAWTNMISALGDDSLSEAGVGEFVTKFTDSLLTVADNVVPRIEYILNGMVAAINQLMPKISENLPGLLNKLLPGIIQGAVALVNGLVSALPSVVKILIKQIPIIAKLLIAGFKGVFPTLINTGKDLFGKLFDFRETATTKITESIPVVVDKIIEMIGNFGTIIQENLPTITNKALDTVEGFVTLIEENAPKLIQAGLGFLQNLAQGIMDALPTLIARVPEIVSRFANVINDNAPKVLKAGFNILVTVGKGLINALPTLVANIPKIITAIIDVWEAFNWLNLGKKVITGIKNGVTGLLGHVKDAGKKVADTLTNTVKNLPGNMLNIGKKLMSNLSSGIRGLMSTVSSAGKSIFNSLWNTIKSLPSKVLNLGKDIVRGLWNGISDMAGWIADKIESFGEDVLDGIKDFFGIESPSKVMRDEVGRYIVEGVGVGIEKNEESAIKPFNDVVNRMIPTAQGTVANGMNSTTSNNTMLEKMYDLMSEYLPTMSRLQVVLDSGALVGELTPGIDEALGMISDHKGRGN